MEPVLTTKPDALLGPYSYGSPGYEPVYQERYKRVVLANGTTGPFTIEVTPENSAATGCGEPSRSPRPREGEREALKRLRTARKARNQAAKRSRRRNRLRRS